jgi:GntR family transcriptional regulator
VPRSKHETPSSTRLPDELSYHRPKGDQLREILESFLTTLTPGDLLPSERALAERFGVARMTVRAELDRLVTEGLVYRRRGHGTFVAEPKLAQRDSLTSFSEDMGARGMVPGSRVLSITVEPAGRRTAARLEIPRESPIVHIVRVRTADGVPMAIERTSLPSALFPGLEQANLADESLYQVLDTRYGVQVDHADQHISAIHPNKEDAGLLSVSEHQPVFAIERVTRVADGTVIEFSRATYRGDRYEVVMRIQRKTP